jgi:predicted nicotinamide N-methyase
MAEEQRISPQRAVPSSPPPPPPPPSQPKLKSATALQRKPTSQNNKQPAKKLAPLIERAIATLQWRKGSGSERFVEVDIKGTKLRILQKPGGEERNEGTGGTVWDCALVMSKYFERLSETQNWSDKNVLEVGSGTGIVGIVAAILMKPKTMVITDIMAQLPLMEQNVNEAIQQLPHNEELKRLRVQEFDWCKDDVTLDPPPPYDIVVASDCIFPKLNNQWLLNALLKVTSSETLVLIGYEYRTASSRQNFFQRAEEFFICERIPENELHPQYIADDIVLYRLKRKK